MKKSVSAAVRAGLSSARISQHAPAPSGEVQPPVPTRASLRRRVLRVLKRLVRPVASPILHRAQFRMGAAIDASAMHAAVGRIEGLMADGFKRIEARLEAMADEVQRLEQVELRLEALRRELSQQRAVSENMGRKLDLLLERSNLLLQRRLVPFGDVTAVRTGAGYLLAPSEDPGLVLSLLETQGELEPGTAAVLQALTPSGGRVIDVGANVGALTVPVARRVGPNGRVLALEPAPRVVELLRRTVEMNGLSWVEVQPVAASDQDGLLRFNLSGQTTHNSVLPLEDVTETIDIPSRRLDTLIPAGERVDLVKIDVEGAELQVWRGMQRIVSDNPDIALLLEFGPSHLRKAGQSIAGWFGELQSTGLTAWEVDESSGRVAPVRRDGLADVFSMNILLLRDPPSSRGLTMP